MIAEASLNCIASAVSMTSEEVMPTCKIARIVADGFGHRAQKRDDLMLDLGFDLANALDVEARFFANARDRRFGNFAELRQTLGSEDFDFEPFLKTIFLGPDTAHLRPGVTLRSCFEDALRSFKSPSIEAAKFTILASGLEPSFELISCPCVQSRPSCRSDDGNSSTSCHSARTTRCTTIWAMRWPRSMTTGSAPRLIAMI